MRTVYYHFLHQSKQYPNIPQNQDQIIFHKIDKLLLIFYYNV